MSLLLLLVALPVETSVASPRLRDYPNFLDRSHDGGCVDGDRFDELFTHLRLEEGDGGPWNFYIPRYFGSGAAQSVAPIFNRELHPIADFYTRLLRGTPVSSTHPLKVVIMNEVGRLNMTDESISGLMTSSCEGDGASESLYIFVPASRDLQTKVTLAHEMFHAWQARKRPDDEVRHGPSWWKEATAEFISTQYYGTRQPSGIESVAWRFPGIPLDTFRNYNPGHLAEQVNGVEVLNKHPYVKGSKFVEFISGRFGVRPSEHGLINPEAFGEFLSDTFTESPVSAPRSVSGSSEIADRVVDRSLRASGRDWLITRDGLGGAFALFMASRISGEEPPEIAWDRETGRQGAFYSFSFTPQATTGRTITLRASLGLSGELVELAPPAPSVQSLDIRIVGQLAPTGRLFMQAGSRETSPGEPLFGFAPFADVSEEARSPESPDAPIPLEGDPLRGRNSYFCMSNAPSLRFSRWPDTGRLRFVLVNAAPSSVHSSPVTIGLRITPRTTPCMVSGIMNPADPGGRYLQPDGSGNECPEHQPRPEHAPPDWEPPRTVCDAVPAPYEAPPENIPPLSRQMTDPWSSGQPLRPVGPQIVGEGGLDCEQNRRDRERDRRAGRRRTESEQIVDRICDRLRRERREP